MAKNTASNGNYSHGKEIGALQADMDGVKNDITEIKTNHLPHIYAELGAIKTQIAKWVGGAGAVIGLIELWTKFR